MFSFFIPKEAFAHAYVVSSNPVANEELDQQPPAVSITFSEGIESGFHAIKVFNAKGDRVDQGDTVIKEQKIMEAALKKFTKRHLHHSVECGISRWALCVWHDSV